MNKYYFKRNDEVIGPVLIDDLIKLIELETLISTDSSNWAKPKNFPEVWSQLEDKINSKSNSKKSPPPIPDFAKRKTPPPIPKNRTEDLVSGVSSTVSKIKIEQANKESQASNRQKVSKDGLGTETGGGRSWIFFVLFIAIAAGGYYLYVNRNSERSNVDSYEETSSSEINEDPTMGVVGHELDCSCDDCSDERDEHGNDGNWRSGSYQSDNYDSEYDNNERGTCDYCANNFIASDGIKDYCITPTDRIRGQFVVAALQATLGSDEISVADDLMFCSQRCYDEFHSRKHPGHKYNP